jgi:hypothetical protein
LLLFIFLCHNGNQVCKCKIWDRQTSGPIRTLSADFVCIANHGVLGVAQFLLPTHLSGRGTCMQLQVADRQEGSAVSVNLWNALLSVHFTIYYSGEPNSTSWGHVSSPEATAPCSQCLTAVSVSSSFISIVLTVAVQRLCAAFID